MSDAPDTQNPVLNSRMLEGVALFNKREFFECHEILEDLWKAQVEPEKQLTQGIIQIAVAYYHALRDNRVGALKLLKRGIPRVKPFLPEHKNLQLKPFIESVEQDMERIEAGRPASELILPNIEILA